MDTGPMDDSSIKPMYEMSVTDVRERRHRSLASVVVRIIILVAAIAFELVARYVWQLPDIAALGVAGIALIVVVAISISLRVSRAAK
jgi:hypothetical protein